MVKKLVQSDPLVISVTGPTMKVSLSGIRPDFSSEELLNVAKAALTKYYEEPHKQTTMEITNSLDIYRGVLYEAKKLGAQFPSNAWSKYMEIYTSIADIIGKPIIDCKPTDKSYSIFCNAELPGSSISSINHFFKTKLPKVTLDWIGSSFKPDGHGTQLGDTYGFYDHNKTKWLFNEPGFNGDMTDTLVVRDCAKRYLKHQPLGCQLYSHDAGLDVTVDQFPWKAYVDQERMNMKLHLGCAIVGLETLRDGGSFIAKQYTLYEENSKNLIMIYAQFFDDFYLVKPVTSRPYNSESYFVGLGFKKPKNANELLSRLYDLHGEPDITMTSLTRAEDRSVISIDGLSDIDTMLAAIDGYMDVSAGRQIRFLNETTQFLERSEKADTQVYKKFVDTWLKKCRIDKLDHRDWLPSNSVQQKRY